MNLCAVLLEICVSHFTLSKLKARKMQDGYEYYSFIYHHSVPLVVKATPRAPAPPCTWLQLLTA